MFIQLLVFVFALNISNGSPIHDMKAFFDANDLSSRIIGGEVAPEGYAPYMVALLVGDVFTMLVCGGSIITEHHVLSAAHCIEPFIFGGLLPTFRGIVGNNYWNSTETAVRFTGYNIHREWDFFTIKNDIGLLRTERIVLNERVRAIALNYEWVDEEPCLVTGWGSVGIREVDGVVHMSFTPDRLKLLYVNTITTKDCKEGVEKASEDFFNPPKHNSTVEICTFHSAGKGMCHGDSGSALVQVNILEQIGIVSWGFPCAIGAPDVFVRLTPYKEYIDTTIRNDEFLL